MSGNGAKKNGGRWNSPGRAVVYLSEHPALAALEVLVHLDLTVDLLPDDYVLLGVDLPDEPPSSAAVVPDEPRVIGDQWLQNGATAVLQVPSFVIPSSKNLLLNPVHENSRAAKIAGKEPFTFDERLLRGGT